MKKTYIDLISFALGGALFGLCTIVLTVKLFEDPNFPGTAVHVLNITLVIICIIAFFYILFRRLFFKRKTNTTLKSLRQILGYRTSPKRLQKP